MTEAMSLEAELLALATRALARGGKPEAEMAEAAPVMAPGDQEMATEYSQPARGRGS